MYSSQTPIDIHCTKLVDWLVQRRHCTKNWGENLAAVRRKIRAALKDMPENEEIKQILIDSKLDYFISKRIVEILKTTEASSKNIFGRYSSQRMKDWQDIVNSYSRENIYIAEIATDLIRQTNYEVPGIRKIISKLNKEREEAEKEKANVLKKAEQFQAEHQKLAQSYEITGQNVEQELLEKSKNLDHVMSQVATLTKALETEVDEFCQTVATIVNQDGANYLSMLKYIIKSGNTTVYQWRTGQVPDSVVKEAQTTSTADHSNPSEIELVDDEIDFGDDLPSSESSSGFVHVEKTSENNEETFIQVEEAGQQDTESHNIARGDDAKSVIEFRKSRSQFMNNLYELEAFCQQISLQNDSKDNDANLSFDMMPGLANNLDSSSALRKIRAILDIMEAEKNRILFQMNDSPCFVSSLRDSLASKLKKASDYRIKAEHLSEHIKELQSQIREMEIHLKKNIALAKTVQAKVEASISDLYAGRPINIMGCIGQNS